MSPWCEYPSQLGMSLSVSIWVISVSIRVKNAVVGMGVSLSAYSLTNSIRGASKDEVPFLDRYVIMESLRISAHSSIG
jgi:hypothetical protein